MTDLKKTQFEIFKIFTDICNKLNLKYFMVCGSALGAVKYNGFIPWDDDIDVGMFREDYEVFIQKAPLMLQEPYFLQNFKTDPKFPRIFSKLRNSNTTYIEKSDAFLPINHGVYIDIFPLDGYPKSKWKQYIFKFKRTVYGTQLASVYKLNRRWTGKAITALWRALGCHKRTEKIIVKYDKLISSNKIKDSELICNFGNWQGKLEYAPAQQYGNGKIAVFEGINVYVPEQFDEYLTQKYGDWGADLPEEQKFGHHYYEICDLGKSYIYYKNSIDVQSNE